jgi:predicted Zn-dependent protease
MKITSITFLFSLLFSHCFSQLNTNYKPADSQDTISSVIYNRLTNQKAIADASIHESAKVTAFMKELNQNRFDLVVRYFNDDLLITDSKYSPYLQSILDRILKANPDLPATSVYAFRSETANAMSFGDGVIGFTLGLLARLETEDQIAFVICHELAHYSAKHTEAKTRNYARLNFDKEVKKKIKAIERSEYNKYSKLNQLGMTLGQFIGRHSREKELEADSLALQFFLKASFDQKASIRTLEILDSADISLYTDHIPFKKHFDTKQYPFKEEWLAFPPSEMVYAQHLKNDSLRTHPSCEKRIAATKRQLSRATGLADANENPNKLRAESEFEILASAFHFNAFGRALFLSLQLLAKYPNNAYLHSRVIECLREIYVFQKKHELSQVVSLMDPDYDENYNQFLRFVHNLRLSEIISLAYAYASNQKESFMSDEEFVYAYYQVSKETNSEDALAVKTQYLSHFPKGKYYRQLNRP